MSENPIFSREPEDFYYMDRNVPCQGACPASTNIPAYIRALFEGRYGESYEINRMANILPGVLGRICSRPCEDKCRHGEPELGKPVSICHIKRTAADHREDRSAPPYSSFPDTGKQVAIIGSGPTGLAAAHDLRSIGVSVTLFEALDRPGGMLAYGIPPFRLPRSVLEEEINDIMSLGVTLKTGVRVGRDVEMQTLLSQYDALLLATGCYTPKPLNIPGETLPGVFPGLTFMMDICAGKAPPLGKRILVLGAGFTAFDCARSALRLGAEKATICLRRTEEDLTVTGDEILETKREGITISTLMVSTRILGKEHVEAVEFLRTQPGEQRPDGKKEVSAIPGSGFVLAADTVIMAIGQGPGPLEVPGVQDGRIPLETDKGSTTFPVRGLYAAGDYVTGPSTVIEAIAAGRRAAGRIAQDLTGKKSRERVVRLQGSKTTDRKRTWDFIPRQEMPMITSTVERIKTPAPEVETGYSREQGQEEAKRCYLCYLHYEIDLERCIYCRYCIDVAPRDCIRMVEAIKLNEAGAIVGFAETAEWRDVNAIVIDNERCIRCGECRRVCPVDCISVTRVELVERVSNGRE